MFEKAVVIVIFVFTTLFFSFMTRVEKISTDKQNKKIAGVCAGLSRASSMPVWMIRAFFITFAFFLGFGIVFYLSLWLFMIKDKKEPESKTAIQKDENQQT